jgi:hypothetical protein
MKTLTFEDLARTQSGDTEPLKRATAEYQKTIRNYWRSLSSQRGK